MDGRAPRQFGNVEDCVEQATREGRPAHRALRADRRRQARRARQRLLPPRRRRSRHRARDPDRPDAGAAATGERTRAPAGRADHGEASSATRRSPPGSRRCAPGQLPPNMRVQEFFMEPGAWLHAPLAQQSYASINYTHVARSVLAAGRERRRPAGRAPPGRARRASAPTRTSRPTSSRCCASASGRDSRSPSSAR